jgi:hypothetical protein
MLPLFLFRRRTQVSLNLQLYHHILANIMAFRSERAAQCSS